jgi:hypothetical protein
MVNFFAHDKIIGTGDASIWAEQPAIPAKDPHIRPDQTPQEDL